MESPVGKKNLHSYLETWNVGVLTSLFGHDRGFWNNHGDLGRKTHETCCICVCSVSCMRASKLLRKKRDVFTCQWRYRDQISSFRVCGPLWLLQQSYKSKLLNKVITHHQLAQMIEKSAGSYASATTIIGSPAKSQNSSSSARSVSHLRHLQPTHFQGVEWNKDSRQACQRHRHPTSVNNHASIAKTPPVSSRTNRHQINLWRREYLLTPCIPKFSTLSL